MCQWQETYTDDYYTAFRSKAHPNWLLGFSRRGKPLPADGSKHKPISQRMSYHFVKVPADHGDRRHDNAQDVKEVDFLGIRREKSHGKEQT